jgi:hypothetical protein
VDRLSAAFLLSPFETIGFYSTTGCNGGGREMGDVFATAVAIPLAIVGFVMSVWFLRTELVPRSDDLRKRRQDYISGLEERLRELQQNRHLSQADLEVLVLSLRRSIPLDPRDSKISWIITGLAAGLGAISIAILILTVFLKYPAKKVLLWPFVSLNPVGEAIAATADINSASASLAPFIPYFLGAVLLTMFIAFISAIVVLFRVPDTPENQTRLKAAGDLVKTFGGFFTGIATTLLH